MPGIGLSDRFWIILILLSSVTACYSPGGPEPEQAHPSSAVDYTVDDVYRIVERRDERLYAPLSMDIPEACQWLNYNRFAPKSKMEQSVAEADAILVLIPGTLAGANSLTYLAEQLVYHAAQSGQHLEVIATERRNQCLNDMKGLNLAEQSGQIQDAIEYYYGNLDVEGRRYQGIVPSSKLGFLVDFGLERSLLDLQTLITTLVPNPQTRQQKLFIGGHSLGGNVTSAYMGWDFDHDRSTDTDAGFRQAAGFIRLDIGITPKDEALDPFLLYGNDNESGQQQDTANAQYRKQISMMRLGLLPKTVRYPGVNPETLLLLDMLAMEAYWHPDAENTLVKELPLGVTPRTLLRLIHSRNIGHFAAQTPTIEDFRFTNQALLGIALDDDFMPITILQASMGFLGGGPVVEKSFPTTPTLRNLAGLIDPFLEMMLTSETLYIANDAGADKDHLGQGPLYRWINFDETGDDNDPLFQSKDGTTTYTTTTEEMSDINDMARIIFQGKTSFTEWYMPARLTLDLQQLAQPEPIDGLPYWHAKAARVSPLLEIVGNRSIVDTTIEPLGELVIGDGYNHLDVITAAHNRSERREGIMVKPILGFINKNLQTGVD